MLRTLHGSDGAFVWSERAAEGNFPKLCPSKSVYSVNNGTKGRRFYVVVSVHPLFCEV
jgi:hypothetical protein